MKRSVFALCTLGLLAGCSTTPVTMGIDTSPTGTSKSAVQASSTVTSVAATTVTPTHSAAIVVTRVRLLVNDAKLQGGEGHDAAETGPFVIDLSQDEIARGAHRDFIVNASPTATYTDAELEIEPLDLHQTGGDASSTLFDDFRTSGVSMIVDGTFKGTAFRFTGRFKAEQGKTGTYNVATGARVDIKLAVNTATWFVDANGADMDPTDTAQHSAVAVAICKQLDTEVPEASTGTRRGPGGGQGHCVE